MAFETIEAYLLTVAGITGSHVRMDSPKIQVAPSGMTATMVLTDIPRLSLYDAATDDRMVANILGGVDVNGLLHLPKRFGYYVPGGDDLDMFATAVDVEPMGGMYPPTDASEAFARADKFDITIRFESVDWRETEICAVGGSSGVFMYIHEEFEPGVEFLTVPAQKLYWDTAQEEALIEAEAPGIRFTRGVWRVTWYFVKLSGDPDVREWFARAGKVNTESVYSYRYAMDFAAGKLLIGEPELQYIISAWGVEMGMLTVPMRYDVSGWNLFMRAGQKYKDSQIYDGSGANHDPYEAAQIRTWLPWQT